MGGLLLGILVARTIAGYPCRARRLADRLLGCCRAHAGQRGGPTTAAATVPRGTRLSYPRLLASTFALVRDEPVLRLRMIYGVMSFGAFSVLWTSIAFLLAGRAVSLQHRHDRAVRTHRSRRRPGGERRGQTRGRRSRTVHDRRDRRAVRLMVAGRARTALAARADHRRDRPRPRGARSAHQQSEPDLPAATRSAGPHHLGLHDRLLHRRCGRLRARRPRTCIQGGRRCAWSAPRSARWRSSCGWSAWCSPSVRP